MVSFEDSKVTFFEESKAQINYDKSNSFRQPIVKFFHTAHIASENWHNILPQKIGDLTITNNL